MGAMVPKTFNIDPAMIAQFLRNSPGVLPV
jgi:hypothetical protein